MIDAAAVTAAPLSSPVARRSVRAAAPLVAAAVTLPVALMAIDGLPVGVVHDDGMYTVLANALATGQGYRWINLPGAPAATHYPPGYPAFLALVWRVFPEFPANVMAFKAANAILLAIVAAMVVVFARRALPLSTRAACLVAVAGCIAVPTLVLSTLVMSEMLFLALLVPALLFAQRVLDDTSPRLRDALALGAAGGALMLVRTHGVAFVVATMAALLLRRDVRRAILVLGTASVVVLPWQLWQLANAAAVPEAIRGDYGSYGNWLLAGAQHAPLSLAARTFAGTTRELFAMFAGLTTAGIPTTALRLVAVTAASAVLTMGMARMVARARVAVFFLAAYVAIVAVWPFTPARFIWGVWPLIVLAFGAGLIALRDWHPTSPALRALRAGGAMAAGLAVTGHIVYNVRGYRGQWWSSIPRSTAAAAWPTVTWVAAHTPPRAVVASNAELMIYLYTGRPAVPSTRFAVDDYFALPGVASRTDALRSILGTYRIDAVAIVANDSLEAAVRAMAVATPPTLSLVDSVPRGLILTPTAR